MGKTMENIQNEGQDPNEKLAEFKVDEVRTKIIEDFGLDETEQSDLIDKLVNDKQEEHKKFSTAISQKINWRTKFQDLEKNNPSKPDPKPPTPPQTLSEDKINEVLEKRELESLEVSDEMKKEIQDYAKLKNLSVKKAQTSEYILFRMEQEEKKEKIDNASIGGGRKPTTKKDYSEMKATDFDMRTPEGKADFAKYREEMRKKLG
jgi:hypothetical protein